MAQARGLLSHVLNYMPCQFLHVKSHVGEDWNKHADELANAGRLMSVKGSRASTSNDALHECMVSWHGRVDFADPEKLTSTGCCARNGPSSSCGRSGACTSAPEEVGTLETESMLVMNPELPTTSNS
eukprot:2464358-Karenia_brevis.AAC.1